jgi:hypothetical protein
MRIVLYQLCRGSATFGTCYKPVILGAFTEGYTAESYQPAVPRGKTPEVASE